MLVGADVEGGAPNLVPILANQKKKVCIGWQLIILDLTLDCVEIDKSETKSDKTHVQSTALVVKIVAWRCVQITIRVKWKVHSRTMLPQQVVAPQRHHLFGNTLDYGMTKLKEATIFKNIWVNELLDSNLG